MTQRDIDTVRKMATLARLAIGDAEAAAIGAQFAHILEHFEVLAKLPIEGIEPTPPGTSPPALANVLRDDVPQPSLAPDAVLADAPQRIDDFYGVPKTVGGEE
jgi:aspartyl-tRNA(Asn)/glutamyl-tRNA(Gln) amidotransferase subunit C